MGVLEMALTDRAVRNAKAKVKQYKLSDAGGLYLLVTPQGGKYWRLKYRFGGKEKLLALGVFDQVSLATAREERDIAKRLLKDGRDPGTAKKLDSIAAAFSAANTFEAIAMEWLDQQRNRWTAGHAQRVLDSMKADLFEDLGPRPIVEIKASEILAALRKVEKRGVLETAQRLLQRCNAVLRYAVVTNRAERNPAADLRGALKVPQRTNYPALSAADLPAYLKALEGYQGHIQTKLGLKLLALTFVRSGELRAAEWAEFDFKRPEWRIPAERMKMGVEHIVPLSSQAIAVLDELKKLTGRSRFLFPNQTKPDICMSENTMLYALYRMGYHGRATGHGFRATASTILNEQGWKPDAIERQLAHAERNKVRAAYHRSEYLDERRKMMQAWADYLDAIGSGAKVTPIKRAKAA